MKSQTRYRILKTTAILIATFLFLKPITAQVLITGKVNDPEGLPLPGANVSIKNSYDGATADTAGRFSFRSSETGSQILMVSFIGYKTEEINLDLTGKQEPLQIKLKEQSGEIKSVVISAGAFETGDIKRPLALKPMDIATTPSAGGDIYGALNTLPGTQMVGNEGGIFVRGGEGYETKTFIDGMEVANPYMAKMPDLPTRSRFSPLLFSGTAFSSGGYSAEFGQALSSAINLSTAGLADANQGSFSIMSVGGNASLTHRWENASITGTLEYLNMGPYFSLFNQRMEWKEPPVQTDGTLLFRKKYWKYGMLKIFGFANTNKSSLYFNYKGDSALPSLIKLTNNDVYLTALYNDKLSENWLLKTGLSFNYNLNKTGIDSSNLNETIHTLNHRLTITHNISENISLKFGEEISWYYFDRSYYSADSVQTYDTKFSMLNYAVYAEPEFKINEHFIARAGIRGEYSSLINEWSFVPRISLAYKTGNTSQFSMAYGLFNQRPENQYLLYNHTLQSEKATHIILNYQYEQDNQLFRIEIYRKWYNKLIKFQDEYSADPANFSNLGKGYAQGIELFWRDSKSVPNLDYWISYSFIDTKRDYKNFTSELIPSFVSKNTASIVMKYFLKKMDSYLGITYTYAGPKTWYNPNILNPSGDETSSFNDMSLNILIIRPFLGSFVGILFNVSNILGFDNTYGYHYSTQPDNSGKYAMYPIKPQSKRFFVIGAYFMLK
jgi:hypothetical protein